MKRTGKRLRRIASRTSDECLATYLLRLAERFDRGELGVPDPQLELAWIERSVPLGDRS